MEDVRVNLVGLGISVISYLATLDAANTASARMARVFALEDGTVDTAQ